MQATIRANKTGHFLWIGSDSWGAKVHPVKEQEFAAEGAITILPTKNAIRGNEILYFNSINFIFKNQASNKRFVIFCTTARDSFNSYSTN